MSAVPDVRGVAAEAASPPEPWEKPSPLGGHGRLPAFPVDALPGWLAAEVGALATFTQTPPDLAATVALAVLAAAAGGRAVVEVRGTWREPLNLFTVAAMPSGARKSPVFAELTSPLLDAERTLIEQARPQIVEAETQRGIARRKADQLAARASGEEGEAANRATADAIGAAVIAEAITVPVMPRLVADDVTPEAAASLLAEHGGRLAVLSAEGGIFGTLGGRYSSGVPSFEVFLKGHAGDLLRVDRKGRLPEHITSPALTLGLCVQPEVLRAIAVIPGFRGRGLLARILYSVPANLVGTRQVGAAAVPAAARDEYARSVQSLVLTLAEWTDPAVLTLSPEAAALVLAAERALEPRLHPETGDLAGIVDWASKLIGAIVRIAGLLHLAGHLTDGWGRSIDAGTMEQAIRIGGYFLRHALMAFDAMGVEPVVADARELLRWIERTQPGQFTKREIFTAVSRSRFPKVGDLDPALDLLEQHGWIRRRPDPERTGPGRPPSAGYDAHPSLAVSMPQKPQFPQKAVPGRGIADTAVSAASFGESTAPSPAPAPRSGHPARNLTAETAEYTESGAETNSADSAVSAVTEQGAPADPEQDDTWTAEADQ